MKEIQTYVYKITRKDGLSYIGITIDPEKRFKNHRKSDRFSIGIDKIEILNICDNYEDAEELEEKYISLHDTYENGLNLTETGKGAYKHESFNTLGFKFSNESKSKMSTSAKKRGSNNTGYKHSCETKKKLSGIRKGKNFCPRKISVEDNMKIYESYKNDEIIFKNDFIKKFIKKNQRENIDNLKFSDLKSPNGKPLEKIVLYSHHYANIHKVSHSTIRKIIKQKGKTSPDYESNKV